MFVGGTRMQRRAGSAAAILIAGALSSACVSSGREEAGRIADTGLAATSALSADLVGASARLARADALSAWERTWLLCQNPNPALCRPAGPSEAVRSERGRLVEAIRLRARAVEALNRAYNALKLEADYDAAADLEGAVGAAVTSVQSYATALGATGPLETAGGLVVAGAGVFADMRQRERLKEANRRLADAAARMRLAMQAEQAVFDSVATDIVDQEVAAHDALLEGGFVSREELVTPLIEGIGARPAGDLEARFDDSPGALAGARAVLEVSAAARAAGMRARYAASIEALQALEHLHREFVAAETASPAQARILIDRLDALREAAF